jgi:hypothetical protein
MMEKTEETIDWALSKLNLLKTLDGFPRFDDQQPGLRLMARGFLNIVDDQPEHWVQGYNNELGKPERQLAQPFVSAEETVDWLIERILDSEKKFPPLIRMREIYETKWRCADRKLSGELIVE